MRLPRNSNNLTHARSLRKNMTDAERKLWYEYLRPCPYKFTRQKSVGPYILDFYCASTQLAVEIDGSQHYTTVKRSCMIGIEQITWSLMG